MRRDITVIEVMRDTRIGMRLVINAYMCIHMHAQIL